MKRHHTLYLTRDMDGDILLHDRLPERGPDGFWTSDGAMQEIESGTPLACVLIPWTEAVRWAHPIAIECDLSDSSINPLLRKPV